ncbi:hypothetical protein ACFOWM_01875 [Ferruginibacter yonginensis]|uniref:LemA family protein n=1 Tax=Ferruginibacter yonginensis TaxID=1310416 RepID=A0ABV8QMU1_9BACT
MDSILQNGTLILTVIILTGLVYLIREVYYLKLYIKNTNTEAKKLQFLAYERLAMFAERVGLKNLISNAETYGESAAVMHGVLIQNIKAEYEYNVSQQVYVSKEVWAAVTKLKDQNIYIINQLAAMLPPQANSLDLSKRILEYTITQQQELNVIVQEAIQIEAKQKLDALS